MKNASNPLILFECSTISVVKVEKRGHKSCDATTKTKKAHF